VTHTDDGSTEQKTERNTGLVYRIELQVNQLDVIESNRIESSILKEEKIEGLFAWFVGFCIGFIL